MTADVDQRGNQPLQRKTHTREAFDQIQRFRVPHRYRVGVGVGDHAELGQVRGGAGAESVVEFCSADGGGACRAERREHLGREVPDVALATGTGVDHSPNEVEWEAVGV